MALNTIKAKQKMLKKNTTTINKHDSGGKSAISQNNEGLLRKFVSDLVQDIHQYTPEKMRLSFIIL